MVAPRVCPQCGEEYVPTALECVDCGVSLVAEAVLDASAVCELPPASQLVCVRAASLPFARQLSERLAAAGISHRIEAASDDSEEIAPRRPGANLPYGVYVREQDLAAAQVVDREYLHSAVPDLPAEAEGAAGGDGCPACGAPVAPDASECPDCGLALFEPS